MIFIFLKFLHPAKQHSSLSSTSAKDSSSLRVGALAALPEEPSITDATATKSRSGSAGGAGGAVRRVQSPQPSSRVAPLSASAPTNKNPVNPSSQPQQLPSIGAKCHAEGVDEQQCAAPHPQPRPPAGSKPSHVRDGKASHGVARRAASPVHSGVVVTRHPEGTSSKPQQLDKSKPSAVEVMFFTF